MKNIKGENENPLISIIIPIYNAEKYLKRCIESILKYSDINVELILVNDGSDDNSLDICKEFASKYPRIILINQINAGVSVARNRGLEIASGDWIYFCDADDEVNTSVFTTISKIENNKIDIIFFGYIDKNGNIKKITEEEEIVSRYSAKELLFNAPKDCYQGYIWSKLFRRSIIEKYALRFDSKIRYNEDRLFIFEYISKMSGNALLTPLPVYKYYVNDTGAMSSIYSEKYFSYVTDLIAFKKMYLNEINNGYTPLSDSIFYQLICSYFKNKKLIKQYSKTPKKDISILSKIIDFVPKRKRCEYWLYIKCNAAIDRLNFFKK